LLYELHAAAGKSLPEDERYAMVLVRGTFEKGRYEWWVDQISYPYKPSSYTPPVQPVDEHGHGGH
jgi:hypothetical protein